MIPKNEDSLLNNIILTQAHSKTFYLNREEGFFAGKTDGLEAVKQAVYLALNIERYDYVIYSWNYGVELIDLFGQPTNYVCAVLPSRIREALLQDDRIDAVDGFSFERKRGVVSVTFTVHSQYGDFEEKKEVSV